MIFSIGAIGYGIIEILWRGHTHWSMLTAGGLSFLGLSRIAKFFRSSSLFVKALIGSVFITLIEFTYGIIFNIILKKNVWDYSDRAFNIGGQICPLFSFFWFVLSFIFLPLGDRLNKKFSRNSNT